MRLKNLFNNKLSLNTNKITVQKKKLMKTHIKTIKYFVIPYIRNISEITASLINKSNLKVGFRNLNKISKFIRVHKNQTEHTHIKNVVYKINARTVTSYVEQNN